MLCPGDLLQLYLQEHSQEIWLALKLNPIQVQVLQRCCRTQVLQQLTACQAAAGPC